MVPVVLEPLPVLEPVPVLEPFPVPTEPDPEPVDEPPPVDPELEPLPPLEAIDPVPAVLEPLELPTEPLLIELEPPEPLDEPEPTEPEPTVLELLDPVPALYEASGTLPAEPDEPKSVGAEASPDRALVSLRLELPVPEPPSTLLVVPLAIEPLLLPFPVSGVLDVLPFEDEVEAVPTLVEPVPLVEPLDPTSLPVEPFDAFDPFADEPVEAAAPAFSVPPELCSPEPLPLLAPRFVDSVPTAPPL